MPVIVDKLKLPKGRDRRIKLTPEDKADIKEAHTKAIKSLRAYKREIFNIPKDWRHDTYNKPKT